MAHGPIRQEYAYDLDKNLTGLTVRSGEALLSHASYAYDGNGNRIRKQALDGTTLYQYDAQMCIRDRYTTLWYDLQQLQYLI